MVTSKCEKDSIWKMTREKTSKSKKNWTEIESWGCVFIDAYQTPRPLSRIFFPGKPRPFSCSCIAAKSLFSSTGKLKFRVRKRKVVFCLELLFLRISFSENYTLMERLVFLSEISVFEKEKTDVLKDDGFWLPNKPFHSVIWRKVKEIEKGQRAYRKLMGFSFPEYRIIVVNQIPHWHLLLYSGVWRTWW